MSSTPHAERFELLGRRESIDSIDSWGSNGVHTESQRPSKLPSASIVTVLLGVLPFRGRRHSAYPRRGFFDFRSLRRRQLAGRPLRQTLRVLFQSGTLIITILVIITGLFWPSYTHLPPHYQALKERCSRQDRGGCANILNEKIFISTSLYDSNGHLMNGQWGQALLDLIDMIGNDNVFLAVYENDSGEAGAAALAAFQARLKCKNEIVIEDHVDRDQFSRAVLPDGTKRLKRISYLAEMRNRALRPLDKTMGVQFDKVLILNDLNFYPIDAAQLLFSTHQAPDERTDYLAACAVDYANPFKFYDTFATRDSDGFGMGVPFYPIFSNAGLARSRQDMLAQKDAVRVKSCWSGMVAFEARYLQSSASKVPPGFQDIGAHDISPSNPKAVAAPIRFRSELDLFWEASESCLFLADILQVAASSSQSDDTRIYMNPFVRVATSPGTLFWLPFIRRFERLFSWPHRIVNAMAGMPIFNAHRTINEGQKFREEVWIADSALPDHGSWQAVDRVARNGMYCGIREMQVLLDGERKGDKNWEKIPIPRGRKLF